MNAVFNHFDFACELVNKLKNTPNALYLRTYKSALMSINNDKDREEVERIVDVLTSINACEPLTIVVLVHGIRTHAQWQELLKSELEKNKSLKIYPLGYEYFDLIKFWVPYVFRIGKINKITQKLRNIQSNHPNDNLVVVAHSFGTYIISEILAKTTDIRIYRLLLCGSIIKNSFRWDKLPRIPQGGIINDCGTKDFYPILAKALSWGYGSSGRFGFKTNEVNDRYHHLSHSDFFDLSFMRKFWVPFIVRGECVKSDWNKKIPKPCVLLNVLDFLPIKILFFLLLSIYYQNELLTMIQTVT